AVAAQDFPPYVRLTRRLLLGVDWRVENTVERIAPANGGFSLSLPLLPGEHPQGDGALVNSGRIDVTFNAGSDTVRWTSRLDHAAKLALRAPALGERVEVWEIVAAPMWHVDAQGVPTSASDAGLRFQPLPGETLQLGFSQPVAVGGGSLAFDNVVVQSKVGERSTETTLALTARSTRGGEHAITLPAGAELLEAGRDGPVNTTTACACASRTASLRARARQRSRWRRRWRTSPPSWICRRTAGCCGPGDRPPVRRCCTGRSSWCCYWSPGCWRVTRPRRCATATGCCWAWASPRSRGVRMRWWRRG